MLKSLRHPVTLKPPETIESSPIDPVRHQVFGISELEKKKKFHRFFFLNKNIYEIISIYMYKYIPRLWSWSGEESSVIQPVLGWLLLNLKAPVFSELFKEDSSSSQSVLLEENTKSRLGNLSIHSTLETGTHENLKVELCMWKYTMTSTGNEVEVVATACPAWDPELESSKLSSLVLVA